ncbi:BQ2448_3769 [Microbotryum intermedium]|uniref:BQ2448_3769 protein n=1 Tax=Microbotryum intermedium TaxID=269621 RepID=A0A238FCU8_9BASI|nr:BQ2448_3769 [Microbotryum intermedium]
MALPLTSAQGPTILPKNANAATCSSSSLCSSSSRTVLTSEGAQQEVLRPASSSRRGVNFSPSLDPRASQVDGALHASGSMDVLTAQDHEDQDSDDSDVLGEASMDETVGREAHEGPEVYDNDGDGSDDGGGSHAAPATRTAVSSSMTGSTSTPEGLGIGMDDAQDIDASNESLAGHLRRCRAMTGSPNADLQPYSIQDPFVAAIEGTVNRHAHVSSVEGLATHQQDSSSSDLSTASSTRNRGTYLSVANGPLARYASEGPSRSPVRLHDRPLSQIFLNVSANLASLSSSSKQTSVRSSPKSFFSSLLGRSPRSVSRSQGSIPDLAEPTSRTGSAPRSPQLSTPPRRPRHSAEGFSARSSPQPNAFSPSASSPDLVDHSHLNEPATPTGSQVLLAPSAAEGNASEAAAPCQSPPQRRTPLLAAVASFTRSASMRMRADSNPSSPSTSSSSRMPTHSNVTPTRAVIASTSSSGISPGTTLESIGRVVSAPPQRSSESSFRLNRSSTEAEIAPTIESIGLGLASLTESLSTSRHAQPLCGAILDGKYLLIGTTAGLEFLPLPVPGGTAQNAEGGRRSKNTRKPIQLIKRTRFKELTVLSERSNILLAIAGRNDHVRVYALEGIRAMINRAMATLDAQDGYAYVDGQNLDTAEAVSHENPKGKGRATSSSLPHPAQPFRFTARAPAPITVPPPPDYSSLHNASNISASSPTRSNHRRQALTTRPGLRHSSSASIVRAVPMNPRPVSYHGPSTSGSINANAINSFNSSTANAQASARSLRGSRSREFVASRRNSTATIVSKRRSRGDLSRYSITSLRGECLDASGVGPSLNNSVSVLTSTSGTASSAEASHSQGEQDPSGRWESSTSVSDSPSSQSTNGLGSRSLSKKASGPDALPIDSGDLAEVDQALPEAEVQPGNKPAIPSPEVESDSAQRDAWIDRTRVTTIKKIAPREPTIPRIAPGQVSPSMMLAEFLRNSEPPLETQDLEVPHDVDPNRTSSQPLAVRRDSALPRLPDEEGDDSVQMRDRSVDADARDGVIPSGRSSSSSGSALSHVSELEAPPRRMIARGAKATMRPETGDGMLTEAMNGLTFSEIIRDEPPPPPSKPRPLPSSSSVTNGLLSTSSLSTPGTSARASKRWSMGNVGSRLLSRPSASAGDGSGSASLSTPCDSASSGGPLSSTSTPWIPPRSASAPVLAESGDADRPFPPRPSTSETVASSTIDNKRRGRPSPLEPSVPKVPQSSRVPSDAHPANAASPLDYVKLARTKGARLLRAVETKKWTYLAVLGGDDGDRIELFTGSRGISLSLNRTFVLPERPRTIEFQLQGDDLVDIYLVYSESIFALEPATVRVREVGVGRGERRARRERERRMRDLATSASESVEGADLGEHPLDPSVTPHPAESVSQRTPTPDSGRDEPSPTSRDTPQATMFAGHPSSGPPSGVPPHSHFPLPPNGDFSDILSSSSTPTMANSPNIANDPSTIGFRLNVKFTNAPYTTFQQLPFIPPVPSSILASAWTIPPLYTDVVGADADAEADAAMPESPFSIPTAVHSNKASRPGSSRIEPPLLSPISLLGPAVHGSQGPPGLFFVTKGSNLSGIVTAEGKSVIKRPLVWTEAPTNPDPEQASFVEPNRIEILICKRSTTVIINLTRSGIYAIAVAGLERDESPFGDTVSVAPASGLSSSSREIAWLGTHPSTQLFFAERVGSSFVIKCLYARH